MKNYSCRECSQTRIVTYTEIEQVSHVRCYACGGVCDPMSKPRRLPPRKATAKKLLKLAEKNQ